MKDKLRELAEMVREAYCAGFIAACKWPSPVSQDVDSPAYTREFNAWSFSVREKHAAILDAEGDGGAVAWEYRNLIDGEPMEWEKCSRSTYLYWSTPENIARGVAEVRQLYTHPARSGVVSDEDVRDAEFFRWHYSKGCRTESNALVGIELRIINNDWPTIDEVRAAYESAIQGERYER